VPVKAIEQKDDDVVGFCHCWTFLSGERTRG
jgi:hypothetical protein